MVDTVRTQTMSKTKHTNKQKNSEKIKYNKKQDNVK